MKLELGDDVVTGTERNRGDLAGGDVADADVRSSAQAARVLEHESQPVGIVAAREDDQQ